jgi:glutaredoxin/uncharacterized protein (UPF0333 family)
MRNILLTICAVITLFGCSGAPVIAYTVPLPPQETAIVDPVVHIFGRDECGFCKAELAYLEAEGIPFVYLNVVDDPNASALFTAVAEKHGITKVTPINVIGEEVIVGFNGPLTTGEQIKKALERAKASDIRTVEDHLARAPQQTVTAGAGCTGVACEGGTVNDFVFDLPFIGIVDLKTLSLTSLSALLGFIDGFNPCAMWVLITFLALLSQAGSRRKMIFLAGMFILAQGIMYNLILNVWYKTWDFVALDQIVTPLVGVLALGGGMFFLYRWYKNRDLALVCDISSVDSQMKTVDRFRKVVNEPITVMSIVAILVIAFSVNIIEFACSIGIPQAYTKILELNMLTFFERQWYMLIFTLGYMMDDVIVFGLAIWGYGKLQAHGQKYAQYSLLVGGVLMAILGVILIAVPSLLVL